MKNRSEFRTQDIPMAPGVYVFRNSSGRVIYVGKAKNLRKRVSTYFQPSRLKTADPKLRGLINSVAAFEVLPVKSESEALLLESRLIKEYNPHYNVMMRDDKRFLLIAVDIRDPFPRAVLTRLKKDDGRLYFGPFPRSEAVRQTIRYLSGHYGVRMCAPRIPDEDTLKHCMDSVMRTCSKPCDGSVSRDGYLARVNQFIDALRGHIKEVEEALTKDMAAFAAVQKYEDAARTRDILENIRYCAKVERQRSFERAVIPPGESNVRVLQKELGLSRPPAWIECFDISNISGTLAVASMVCFKEGKASKKDYRRFRIKTVEGSDDFGMMYEVIGRRYGRLTEEKKALPDLVVVDGGKGQLSAAIRALRDHGVAPIPIMGLAKKREEVFLPGRGDPLIIDRGSPALRLLQAARDEAHRFAVAFHRELRRKRVADSVLSEVEGIGETRRRQLLREFGSVARLKGKTARQIAERVPGIGLTIAQSLVDTLKKRH
ncbi:MAG: excinuclease ABC subunit UvrC [Lentisphaeria bacterium]|nr:excinuclease ABC subunit UvrC [Lentisphaeria bacterium]